MPAHAAICLPIGAAYTLVTLDDCKFHECVDLTEFERDRVIIIHPPDGEVSSTSGRDTIVCVVIPISFVVCLIHVR